MPQIPMAKQVDKLEQDVAGQGGCTDYGSTFLGPASLFSFMVTAQHKG